MKQWVPVFGKTRSQRSTNTQHVLKNRKLKSYTHCSIVVSENTALYVQQVVTAIEHDLNQRVTRREALETTAGQTRLFYVRLTQLFLGQLALLTGYRQVLRIGTHWW